MRGKNRLHFGGDAEGWLSEKKEGWLFRLQNNSTSQTILSFILLLSQLCLSCLSKYQNLNQNNSFLISDIGSYSKYKPRKPNGKDPCKQDSI